MREQDLGASLDPEKLSKIEEIQRRLDGGEDVSLKEIRDIDRGAFRAFLRDELAEIVELRFGDKKGKFLGRIIRRFLPGIMIDTLMTNALGKELKNPDDDK